jgi:membrane protease YdiL (CAAX protease family)
VPPAWPAPPSTSHGPPGGSVFALAGRRAPGLYLVAWILSIAGLVMTFIVGPLASDEGVRILFIGVGALTVSLGLAAGAGSQVLERRGRGPGRYQGPSPLLAFGSYYFLMSALGLLLIVVLGTDPDQPLPFLIIAIVQSIGYLLLVSVFAVRTGALGWPAMGWPTWRGRAPDVVAGSVGAAILVMVPVTLLMVFVGGLIGLMLGVEAPRVLPFSETPLDALAVALAAAVVVPVGEELFFRGFSLTAWMTDLGPRSALVRTSLFFALIHVANIDSTTFGQGLGQAVLEVSVLLPVALVLGWLFIRRGLAAAISAHITYNAILLLLAYLASNLPEPT